MVFLSGVKDFSMTAVKKLGQYVIKLLRSKAFIAFALFVVLAVIFNSVAVPLAFVFVIGSYITGSIFVVWIVSGLIPD